MIIDAGHGGKDPGAQGPSGLKEKEVVLDISRLLKTILEAAGIKVIMTRSTDEFITLPHRTEMASRSDADLFVSIHANSNPARKIEGMEVYYVKTKNKRDLEEEQRQKNEKIFIHRLKMNYSSTLGGIIEDMMYNLKTAESLKLADMISKQSSSFVDTPNRGARTCRFFVVRNTLMPAVLVEVGFLTNRREEKKLSLGSYRQKLADSIAHCIIKYASES